MKRFQLTIVPKLEIDIKQLVSGSKLRVQFFPNLLQLTLIYTKPRQLMFKNFVISYLLN